MVRVSKKSVLGLIMKSMKLLKILILHNLITEKVQSCSVPVGRKSQQIAAAFASMFKGCFN
jgi:hypothetical protein